MSRTANALAPICTFCAVTEGARTPWRWPVLVPLATLCVFGVGFVIARATRPPDRPLDVTPPPEAELPGIVLHSRTRALAGSVVGPDGVAIADALVSTIASDEPHWTFTDEHGAFALENLGRGPWTITVTATSHQPYTTTLADDGASAVLRLPDAARSYPRLAPHLVAPLDGVVAAPGGSNLAGLEVLFTPKASLEEIDAPFPRRVQCDSGGKFRVPDLQAGEYTVIVLPEWAQNGSWPDLARPLGAAPTEYVHAAEGGTLALALAAGAVHGVVADQEHLPLAGALVLVSSESSPAQVWPPATADGEGAFTVLDLPAGRYVVSVRAGSGAHTAVAEVKPRETTDLALPPLVVERPR